MKPFANTKGIPPDEMLRDSEARYRWLFESTAIDGIMILDAQTGQVVDVNPFLIKLLGFSREQFIQKKVWELGYFKDILASKKNFEDLLQKGFVRYEDLPLKTNDGRQIDVEFVGHVYEAGNQKMIQCSIRDTTERTERVEKLRETTEYLENLINNANAPIVVWDSQFRITRFNHAFESLAGRTANEVLHQTLDSLFPPARRIFTLENVQKTLTGEQLQAVEVEIQPINGPVRTLLWSTAPIFDKDGKTPVAAIAQGIDVTEKKRVEKELINTIHILDLALEASQIGIWELDLIKDTSARNLRHDQIFGYTEKIAEWGAKIFLEHIVSEDRPSVQAAFDMAMKTDRLHFECRIPLPDKSIHWITVTGKTVKDSAGKPQKLIGTVTDITERVLAEKKIKDALQEKEILIQEIHHRVKNNLQVVASLFRLQAKKTKNEEALAILNDAGSRIQAMALIQAKLYHSDSYDKLNFCEYADNLAAHLFQVYAGKAGLIRLEMDFEETRLNIISAIPCGLILNELISNALKHAFPGKKMGLIRIIMKHGPDDLMRITVADNGIGIPENIEFSNTDSLGLQIVHLLIGQLGATINLDRTNGTSITWAFRTPKISLVL
jgi:PAS domain S-box-containing protein